MERQKCLFDSGLQVISGERSRLIRKHITPDMLPLVRSTYPGKKISIASGCFDIVHSGHLEFLMQAKECGDILVVGVNDDAYIRAHKGLTRPIIPEHKRVGLIAALGMTDFVFLFGENDISHHIQLLQPDTYVVFKESIHQDKPEYRACEEVGCAIYVVGRHGGEENSTSSIVRRTSF